MDIYTLSLIRGKFLFSRLSSDNGLRK